jgi:hypothetical protein
MRPLVELGVDATMILKLIIENMVGGSWDSINLAQEKAQWLAVVSRVISVEAEGLHKTREAEELLAMLHGVSTRSCWKRLPRMPVSVEVLILVLKY